MQNKQPVGATIRTNPPVDLTSRNKFHIGRSAESDIILWHEMSSRRHAVFYLNPKDGQCYVVDWRSTYGTYINGKRVRPISAKQQQECGGTMFQPRHVKRGSLIRFGVGSNAPAFVLKSYSIGLSTKVGCTITKNDLNLEQETKIQPRDSVPGCIVGNIFNKAPESSRSVIPNGILRRNKLLLPDNDSNDENESSLTMMQSTFTPPTLEQNLQSPFQMNARASSPEPTPTSAVIVCCSPQRFPPSDRFQHRVTFSAVKHIYQYMGQPARKES